MIGSVLEGKYRIARLIGEGGMGVVYEAEHTLIGRPVAVKLLHGEYARDAEVVQRFVREARAATAIRHANIIDVTDMGTTPDGQPFLVMELLEGVPLSKVLEGGRTLPPERLAEIMVQVLDALDAVHRKGIVHRDLKPDNIFLIEHAGRRDFVKVLDFGISKMVSAAGKAVSMTRTGSVLGTPQYMAPEQAMGRKDIDHRVDLWAVGVMLYEASTGRLPYLGDNYNELLTAILMKTPPAPRAVRPEIDTGLETIIVRAMSKEREDRWQTAAEFRDAVRGLSGRQVQPAEAPAAVVEGARPSVDDLRPTTPRAAGAATLTPGAHETLAPPGASARRLIRYAVPAVGILAVAAVALVLALRSGGRPFDAAQGTADGPSAGSGRDGREPASPAAADTLPVDTTGPASPPTPSPASAAAVLSGKPAVDASPSSAAGTQPVPPAGGFAAEPPVGPPPRPDFGRGAATADVSDVAEAKSDAGLIPPEAAAVGSAHATVPAGRDAGGRSPSGRGAADGGTSPATIVAADFADAMGAPPIEPPVPPSVATSDAGGAPGVPDAGSRDAPRLRAEYGEPASPAPRDGDHGALRPGYE